MREEEARPLRDPRIGHPRNARTRHRLGRVLAQGTSREVARRLGTPGPLPAVPSAPARRPGLLIDLVLEPRDLAVLHLVDGLEGGVELRAALRLALEAAGDDDRVALIVVVLRLGRELVEVLPDGREHLVAHALRAVEGPRGCVAAAWLDPDDLRVEPLQHSLGVAAVEGVVTAADRLHVLFRHGFSSLLLPRRQPYAGAGRGARSPGLTSAPPPGGLCPSRGRCQGGPPCGRGA